jgi:hypothetical protein
MVAQAVRGLELSPKPRKPDHLRQRRNKVPSAAQLPTAEASRENEVPPLPTKTGEWEPRVVEWWVSVWKSPMASEYLDADMRGGLYLLADLHQARWTGRDDAKVLTALAAEIRLQEVRFGLSPIDRSRLRWTIEQGETAAERTASRRAAKSGKAKDPRSVLKMVG